MNVKKIALTSALATLCATGVVFAEPVMAGESLADAAWTWASKYKDVQTAVEDGYQQVTGCVNGPDGGAQGVHFLNFGLVGDGTLDPATPEVLLYEPMPSGNMRLVAAEYLTDKGAWHAVNGATTAPMVGGQQMFLLDEPNRFVIPPTYILRVWAFQHNPDGMFSLNNPTVTCEFYSPE